MIKLLSLSGEFYAGKDYVAKRAGFNTILGFADPIYKLVEYVCGTSNKQVPGVRRMQQMIGQWGRGHVDDEYPWTPERYSIVQLIREKGGVMTGGEYWSLGIKWDEFGRRDDFWVDILLKRVRLHLRYDADNSVRVAVTNVRYRNELGPLADFGFEHYHVMATRNTRNERSGFTITPEKENDISERLAQEFNFSMPADRVIWNDAPDLLRTCERPDAIVGIEHFLTPEGFAAVANTPDDMLVKPVPDGASRAAM